MELAEHIPIESTGHRTPNYPNLTDSTLIPNYPQLKTLIDVSDERTLKHYLKLLEDSGLIVEFPRYIKGLKRLEEIGKIVLNDPNYGRSAPLLSLERCEKRLS